VPAAWPRTLVEAGEATRQDVGAVYARTFAHHRRNEPITFDRSFKADLMEDIPSYEKVRAARGAICLARHRLSPAGIQAAVASKDREYDVTLALTGITCTCPAASKFYRGRICKHQACAIHDLLFAQGVAPEARQRAIYVCGHVFSRTLDSGTLLDQALGILTDWGLLERVAVAWKATPLGAVASSAGFDLLLVHQAAQRVGAADPCDYPVIAHWAVDDYIAQEKDQARWHQALDKWLDEVDAHKFKLPTKYRGDFERRLDAN
jgi:hypothetical protein